MSAADEVPLSSQLSFELMCASSMLRTALRSLDHRDDMDVSEECVVIEAALTRIDAVERTIQSSDVAPRKAFDAVT